MPDISITIKGLPELLNRVSQLPFEVQEEISAEILASVQAISAKQKRLAPIDQGGLLRNTGYNKEATKESVVYNLFSNSEHAGYLEFGTRRNVFIPPGLEEIANTFRGPGLFSALGAREAIYAWCERVGIKRESWPFIFITLMIKGLKPHPFFFQPFFDEQNLLLERIERIINEERT